MCSMSGASAVLQEKLFWGASSELTEFAWGNKKDFATGMTSSRSDGQVEAMNCR